MVDDLDTYRAAYLLIKRHGDDAPIEAAMRADELASISFLLVFHYPWSA